MPKPMRSMKTVRKMTSMYGLRFMFLLISGEIVSQFFLFCCTAWLADDHPRKVLCRLLFATVRLVCQTPAGLHAPAARNLRNQKLVIPPKDCRQNCPARPSSRSEEHTSELQSLRH